MFATVPFTVSGDEIDVKLKLPSWNTNRILGSPEILSVGRIGDLRFHGSYMYFADVRPSNVDCLKLRVAVSADTIYHFRFTS